MDDDRLQMTVDRNGIKRWYKDGILHNEGAPAMLFTSGDYFWYTNGILHREDGPAVVHKDEEYWYTDGMLHREDGPAVIYNDGEHRWYINGLLHREDGPAVMRSDGDYRWCLHNAEYTFGGYCDKLNLTNEDILMINLKYGRQLIEKAV